jgi:branched-chain amino acid transport system permease protein
VAFVLAGALMFVVAWLIERLVLRHLVNQEGATLLMATLGIAYVLEGVGTSVFGSDIYKIDVGMPKEPVMILEGTFEGGLLINKEDFVAALIAAVLVGLLALFFQKTATGRALRAVADDHQAAQSIGIPLNRIWVIVWCVAGLVVALVAGVIWGSKLGVQFSLATVALRGAAGGHSRRSDFDSRCDHRRADHRRRREALGGLSRPDDWWRHRNLVCLPTGPGLSAVQAARLFGEKIIDRV